VTRGVAVGRTACQFGLHWLTFSLPAQRLDKLPSGWSAPERRGGFGRRYARLHESGAQVFFDDDEFAVVNVNGETCEHWSREWLEAAAKVGGKMTRVDVACDVEPPDLARRRMLDMRRAFMSGRCETLVERFEEHRSYGEGDGFTWYFGGRQSAVQLRAYDRRGPLRLEFQWRPDDSSKLLSQVLLSSSVPALWRMLGQKLIFPFAWYVELLRGEALTIDRVAPAVASWQKAAMAMHEQHGVTLWALRMLGVPARELERPPGEKIHHDVAAKLRNWAREKGGAEGAALLAAVKHLTRT
jgi:hypothetical protein